MFDNFTDADLVRLNSKLIGSDNPDGCWGWSGQKNSTGRPIFSVDRNDENGKRIVSVKQVNHILYYVLYGEECPTRISKMSCGNVWCVNPRHMSVWTVEERLKYYGKPTKDGCIEWSGHLHNNGYGSITVNGVSRLVHRVSYETHHKTTIPDGMCVCHSCNNRKCMNPEHLYLGTHEDNMKYMTETDRAAKGERNGNVVLTEEQVIMIKKMSKKKVPIKTIMELFDIGHSTVKDIRSGRSWGWLSVD